MSNLGIYIQVPFCASKCTFCNFSSSVERSSIFDLYARMLRREVDGLGRHLPARGIPVDVLSHTVDSIYMGGGTPALLGAERLNLIVKTLRDHLHWGENVEFTLETTPGSVSTSLLQAFRDLGINRLSIGAQTFDDKELSAILMHNRDEEKEHAAMLLEWIRRKDPMFSSKLKEFLFTKKPIAHK